MIADADLSEPPPTMRGQGGRLMYFSIGALLMLMVAVSHVSAQAKPAAPTPTNKTIAAAPKLSPRARAQNVSKPVSKPQFSIYDKPIPWPFPPPVSLCERLQMF